MNRKEYKLLMIGVVGALVEPIGFGRDDGFGYALRLCIEHVVRVVDFVSNHGTGLLGQRG